MNAVCAQVAGYFPAAEQATAYGVCVCESHGVATAHCLDCAGVAEDSRGPMQINVDAHPQFAGWNLYDVSTNAQAALQVWKSQGWNAWSTYANGCAQQHLAEFTGAPPGQRGAYPRIGSLSPRGLIFIGLAAAFVAVAL